MIRRFRAAGLATLLLAFCAGADPSLERGGWTPAAATELGLGSVIPTLHTTAFSLGGRLGGGHDTPWGRLSLMGEVDFQVAFNVGNSVDNYGYLVRVPLGFSVEAGFPQAIDSLKGNYVVHRVALGASYSFALAANCGGTCNYVQAAGYPGVFLRVGSTFTAASGNSVGVFVTPHLSFVKDTLGNGGLVMTMLFGLGWSIY